VLTPTFGLHGRRGACSHQPSFCVAGVALAHIDLRFAWHAWPLLTLTFVLRGTRGACSHQPSFCVAGVALAHIDLRFAWGVALVALG